MWSDFTLGPSFKVKQGQPNLKVLITHLLYPPAASCGILWFNVRYAAAACREIFYVNALRGKLHKLDSQNLQDIFIGGGGGGGKLLWV